MYHGVEISTGILIVSNKVSGEILNKLKLKCVIRKVKFKKYSNF